MFVCRSQTEVHANAEGLNETLCWKHAAPFSANSSGGNSSSRSTVWRLADRIRSIIDRPEFRHAFFGIEFYSLDTGKVIYKLNAEKLFTPASTTKLLTEGTALELLGGDFRFHTRVYRTGPIAADGTLDGDLVLVASGDPDLSGRINADGTLAFENEDHSYDGDPYTRAVPGDPLLVIRRLAQAVAEGESRRFAATSCRYQSFSGRCARMGTGVVISPVVVNDNLIDVTVGPGRGGGGAGGFQQAPATAYLNFQQQGDYRQTGFKARARMVPGGEESKRQLHRHDYRHFPAGKSPILYNYAVPNPAALPRRFLSKRCAKKCRCGDRSAGYSNLISRR